MKDSRHLGFIREQVNAGSVIVHNLDDDTMTIDGRKFEISKDLAILKRHEWVERYTKTASDRARKKSEAKEQLRDKRIEAKKAEKGGKKEMPIIRSDEDNIEVIDIRYTKKQKPEPKQKNSGELEVVRGDESPQERVRRLQEEIPVMPIVVDDSLGTNIGATSLNAGTVKPKTAEEHERLAKEGAEKAARGFTDPRIAEQAKTKTEVVAGVEIEVTPDGTQSGVPVVNAGDDITSPKGAGVVELDANAIEVVAVEGQSDEIDNGEGDINIEYDDSKMVVKNSTRVKKANKKVAKKAKKAKSVPPKLDIGKL